MRVRGYHMGGSDAHVPMAARSCGEVEVEFPRLGAAELRAAIDGAKRAAASRLRARSTDEVLASLGRVVENWLRPDYHLRQLAERALPAATGFSAETVREGLPLLIEPLRADAMRAVLDEELGSHRALDGVCDGRRAVAPSLITHVMSGNLPGLAAAPIVLSLALKSAVLIKSAAGDLIFPALWAAAISEVDDELGRCVVVTHWRGGDRALEDVAFGEAELVVASGSDAAIAAIAARVPGRFAGHGHKVSFALIARECLADPQQVRQLARGLAYDVSLWDQHGCLSPQLCYVETGGRVSPAQFGELVAVALATYARELPPRRLTLDEQAAVLRFRQEAEWGGHDVTLLASPEAADWSVSIEPEVNFLPTCLNRCVRIKPVSDFAQLRFALAPHRRHLEAAGVAVGRERASQLTETLVQCGVHRICRIGTLQQPSLSWRQGGRPRVADWVEWTEVQV